MLTVKILLPIKKYLLENWLPVTAITLITFIVWHKLLGQVPAAESYVYFEPANLTLFKNMTFSSFSRNISPLSHMIFLTLIPLLKDNLTYYMIFQLLVMLLVYQTFYFIVVKITKDKYLSFLAAIFFAANYVGSLNMLGIGNYQRFIQRVPGLPPILISFFLLSKYLKGGKIKYLCFSLILYVVSILLAHFNTLLLPLFLVYPFIYLLLNKDKYVFTKSIIISLLFMSFSVLLARQDPLSRPNDSPITFIQETPDIVKMVLYQISSTAFPQQLTVYLSKLFSPPVLHPYLQTQNLVLIFIAILSIIAFFKGRKYSKILPLYVASCFSLLILSFVIVYAYKAKPNPLELFNEDRIYFLHTIPVAIIWGAMVKFFFGRNKKVYRRAVIIIGLVFLIHNSSLIWKRMDKYQYRSNKYKVFFEYTKALAPRFNHETVIVSPPDLIRTADPIVRRYYNLNEATFILLEDGWEELVAETKADKENVFVLDYEYRYNSKRGIDPLSVKIVDKSEDFRLNKKIEAFVKP